MKTAFTFKKWYWGVEYEKQPPQWWKNFIKEYNPSEEDALKELSAIARVRRKSNGNIRVVFNSVSDLSFFILKWS